MAKRFFLARWLVLAALCLAAWAPAALAAEVSVAAEAGVSEVLAGEFRAVVAKSMEFYGAVYNFTPTKPIRVVVAADEAGYAQALQKEGIPAEKAVRDAKSSAAMSLGSRPVVVVNAAARTNFRDRVGLVTHELFHQMQSQLMGQYGGARHNWLMEGSARVAQYMVGEWMGEGSLAAYRHYLVNTLVNAKLKADPAQLTDYAGWQALVEQRMYPYEISALMTDYLVRVKGSEAVIRYFAAVGRTGSREAAFSQAFGMSHSQFVQEYKAYFAREAAGVGRAAFEAEAGVDAAAVQEMEKAAADVAAMLRGHGWLLNNSLRFVVVADEAAMRAALARELPGLRQDIMEQMARTHTIVPLTSYAHIINVAKATSAEARLNVLARSYTLAAMRMTALPAPPNRIQWLLDGTAQVMVAKASAAAGYKSEEASRQGWAAAVAKAPEPPPLAGLAGVPAAAFVQKHGAAAVSATTALACDYLAARFGPGALANYFTVLRDLNDGPRAFQQAFGMPLAAFETEFAAYAQALGK